MLPSTTAPLDFGIVRALGLTYDNAIRATRAISRLSAVPATASRCRLTPSASAAHTKVLGNTIVQSTRRYASGVIPSARWYRWNRIARARNLSSLHVYRVRLPQLRPEHDNLERNIMTQTSATQRSNQAADKNAIRPFRVNFSETELAELRSRINATKWPERETVTDGSQGVQLATIQALARYWATEYDWRKVEARLNALPQFITEIDGLDIHFIHVRSKHENALPVIVTHGWPGSVTEQLKIIDPLTNPTAHGGTAEDAFDVVIPSMPGYGFSGKPTETGWGP